MRLSVVICVMGLVGCAQPDVHEVEVALGTAAALGQASALAISAMTTSDACVQVTRACSATFPCDGAATINIGEACPLPLGNASTTVMVSGTWSSKDDARVSTSFTESVGGAGNSVVVTATNLTVRRSGTSVTTTYTGQDVRVRGGETLAAQSSWTVERAADGKYTVTGVQQAVGGLNTKQLSVSGAVLDPACRANPVSGSATIQEVGLGSIRQQAIRFHAACDGTAEVDGAAVTLNFDR